MKAKRIIGIILIILCVLSVIGTFATGSFSFDREPVRLIGNLVGFLLPGIIGVILIAKSK